MSSAPENFKPLCQISSYTLTLVLGVVLIVREFLILNFSSLY